MNAKQTWTVTSSVRQGIDALIHHPFRMRHMPPVPQFETSSRPHTTSGTVEAALNELVSESSSNCTSSNHMSTIIREQNSNAGSIQQSASSGSLNQKRKRGAEEAYDSEHTPQKRGVWKCYKCLKGADECMGHSGRSKCRNPCADCGNFTCNGRNSRNPDRKCPNAPAEQAHSSGST